LHKILKNRWCTAGNRGPLHCRNVGFGKELLIADISCFVKFYHFLLLIDFDYQNKLQGIYIEILLVFNDMGSSSLDSSFGFIFQLPDSLLAIKSKVSCKRTYDSSSGESGIFMSLACYCFTCFFIFQDLSCIWKYSVGENLTFPELSIFSSVLTLKVTINRSGCWSLKCTNIFSAFWFE